MGRTGPTHAPRRNPTTAGNWLDVIRRALDALGHDGAGLALQAGVSPRSISDQTKRVPQSAMTRLWRLAVEVTEDAAFGLHVARFVSPSSFGALTHAVAVSVDLESALRRLVRYQRLMTDSIHLHLGKDEDRYRLEIEPLSEDDPPAEELDAFCATWVRHVRAMARTKKPIEPIGIEMRRPAPPDVGLYEKVFRAPITYSAGSCYIEYAREDAEMALPDGNFDLAQQYDQIVARQAVQLSHSVVTDKVHALLIQTLPDGPTESAIAKALTMSRSSLKMLLAREDTTFKSLLNSVRSELARDYLEDGSYSVKEIAFLLGFADATTFTRAFKRWTGDPPQRFVSKATGSPSA